ncbi:MAG: lytic murein transglycosylase B [Pseudomonadota bacterium]
MKLSAYITCAVGLISTIGMLSCATANDNKRSNDMRYKVRPLMVPAAPQRGAHMDRPHVDGYDVQPFVVRNSGYADRYEVKQFIAEMQREHGFKPDQLRRVLGQAEHQASAVRLMTPKPKPAFSDKPTWTPWHKYRKKFLNELRITRGADFYAENVQALKRAEQTYGVPAEIITAIIGVETYYGRNMGSYRVLDALVTLAFDSPRRNEFFKKELKEFMLMVREQRLTSTDLKGSYAGAMGYGQFMPSSYRKYAVDFDGDGRADIWNNPVDAIGSVANYFKGHGWVRGDVVIERARTNALFDASGANVTREPNVSLGQLNRLGFQLNTHHRLSPNKMSNLVELRGAYGKEYWIGFQNFFVITEYNHSRRYALAVYQLAQEIKARQGRLLYFD